MEKILEIKHLRKSFGSHEVLKDIDFTVSRGDVISIIGASGSGKSTLLRCVNLLETPSSGEILYHSKNVVGRHVNAPDYRSHVGMVFQSFNPFNNMTVLENCINKLKSFCYSHCSCYFMNIFFSNNAFT